MCKEKYCYENKNKRMNIIKYKRKALNSMKLINQKNSNLLLIKETLSENLLDT